MKFEYILDTFAWVEYFQGTKKGEIVKNLIEAHKTATPIIVLAELADSYLRMGENIENRENFILSNSTIINLTPGICKEAAKIKLEMRKAKEKDFGLIDAIIYAVSRDLKAKLVTGDPHFKNIKDVMFL